MKSPWPLVIFLAEMTDQSAMLKKKSKIIDGEIWLPEVVIQHIQSFMSGKEAVHSSILSKSWHTAWSTSPNLNFGQRDFGPYFLSYGDAGRFLEYAKRTMHRYEQSNLRIENFRLSMDRRERDNCMLGDDLIARALKLGAIELSVSICLKCLNSPAPQFLFTDAWDLRNLKFLHLDRLNIDPLFSYGSSSEFPSLKVLTLDRCLSKKEKIRISGPSLECISFARSLILTSVALDVPNIREFNFSNCRFSIYSHNILPSLSFESIASMDWVSDVSIVFGGIEIKTSWFLYLGKFLQGLSQSKITLNLEIGSALMDVYDYAPDYKCLRKPAAVEKLTVKLPRQYINGDNNLLEDLFRNVEPKLITQSWEDLLRQDWIGKRNSENLFGLLCKAFKTTSVEEVDVECFEETLAEWRPLSMNTLLDYASTSLGEKQLIRFRLKWSFSSRV